MAACPSCGSPAAAGKPFCGDCGAPLRATSARTETSHKDREPPLHIPARRGSAGARFLPGTELAGRYRIVSLLGKGGMGEVYRADDLKLGQPVALKFLPVAVEARRDRFERLLNEVRLARQVSHPNVCRVHDIAEVDGQHFLSMEYVDGENLASLLKRIGRLPRDKAVELARQICSGLSAAHAEGILHRDLKPANVMIDGRGRARITDFGLAALPEEIGGVDLTAGTPAYMAPEQLSGSAVTVQSDIYALGLVLYELFTGRMAYTASSLEEIVRARSASTPPRPSEHVEGFDPAVESVILRCLEPDPSDRPRSALAVSAALPGGDPLAAALAAGETPSPEMVAAAGQARAMAPGRAMALAALALALFVAAASLQGRSQLRAFLPAVKPPAVMVDRAREIIARLHYTGPPFAEPADWALGYQVSQRPLEEIRKTDPSPGRWERLRDPEAGILRFWYRQSPLTLVPGAEPGSDGRVKMGSPFPTTTGEILVSLEPDGRLRQFVALPRRFTRSPERQLPYDWSLPFELAGLDMAGFVATEPRYQRYMHHDQRAAWEPLDRSRRYRIEAGANEGRLSLFIKVDEREATDLAAEPEQLREPAGPDFLSGFFLAVLAAGAVLARLNVRRGRADTRSALRLAIFFGTLSLLVDALSSHSLLSAGRLAEMAESAVLSGVFVMVMYMALEPTVRATWPSMLVSWTRLLGQTRPGWRDPIVGRAVLAGLLTGDAVLLLSPLRVVMTGIWDGAPPAPDQGSWISILSPGDAWAKILEVAGWSMTETLIIPFFMVITRLLLRRPFPAILAAGAIWITPDVLVALASRGERSAGELVIELLFTAAVLVLMVGLLLRWGLVAVFCMAIVGLLGHRLAPTSDWAAWHAQPAILCTVVVAALAAYAAWASIRGWSLPAGGERSRAEAQSLRAGQGSPPAASRSARRLAALGGTQRMIRATRDSPARSKRARFGAIRS
ncbi:MAG TPA: protein kinase [Candidatus Polarisedimenticolia bacterium]|nr:protein kinase [Candidatus Polarisedimenticolia bacterium]